MITCFICRERINEIEIFFDHLKKSHKLKNIDKFQCTFRQCYSVFDNFSSFKRHVINCVEKGTINPESDEDVNDENCDDDVNDENFIFSVDSDVIDFQKGLNKAAMKLACILCANMKNPRGEIYKTIASVKKEYVNEIISGM